MAGVNGMKSRLEKLEGKFNLKPVDDPLVVVIHRLVSPEKQAFRFTPYVEWLNDPEAPQGSQQALTWRMGGEVGRRFLAKPGESEDDVISRAEKAARKIAPMATYLTFATEGFPATGVTGKVVSAKGTNSFTGERYGKRRGQ